jgi:hypothetical protein
MEGMKYRALALGLMALILLGAAPLAKADAFSFVLATDPVGCSFTANCTGLFEGTGTFFTAPLAPSSSFPGSSVYQVTSVVGQLDGFSMSLTPGNGAIWQPNPSQTAYGIFPFFPIQFTAAGMTWNLIPDSLFPPGNDSILYNTGGTFFNDVSVKVTTASVPEPSELALGGLCLVSLMGLIVIKSRRTMQLAARER